VGQNIELYFNLTRPHQRIEQRILEKPILVPEIPDKGKIIPFPVQNGLHDYQRVMNHRKPSEQNADRVVGQQRSKEREILSKVLTST
jgi:hypothetical protein